MNNPYVESLYLSLVSKRNELMANFHFISTSKPQGNDIENLPQKLDINLSGITEVNSKIDILIKLFPMLKDIVNESTNEKPSSEEETENKFSPNGSSIYEDGELFRQPS